MNKPIDATDPMDGRRRCTAHARSTGERCGNRPIPGGTVCRFHGGAAPAVRRRAKLRLAELVDPAIGTLARVMVKGSRDQDKLRAAEAILDRAGHPRASRVEGQISVDDAREILIQRLLELRAMGGQSALSTRGEVIVAEIVDDGEGI